MSYEAFNIDNGEENKENGISSKDSGNLNSSTADIGIINEASQNGDLKSDVIFDSGDGGMQEIQDESNWDELPSLAVENIYSFLSRTDQSRMSQVCSRWAEEFNSPRVWKTIKFYLPENDYTSDVYPEVKFARRYASMFRHVEIICIGVKYHLIEVIWRQLCWFLEAMESSSQLTSIKFMNMRKFFRCLDHADNTLYKALFKTIISFFNSQENLKTVVFQRSRFSKEEASEILKAILHSDSNTILNLTLHGFIREIPLTEDSDQYQTNLSEVCHRITKVKSLELDYTQMFENIINGLYEKLSTTEYQLDVKNSSLSSLTIFYKYKEELQFRGISHVTWKDLTNHFPHMKVKMKINIHSNLKRELERFLVRDIPIQALNLLIENISPTEVNINTLFTHFQICKYQDHLVDLNIYWVEDHDGEFARTAFAFLKSFKKFNLLAFTLEGFLIASDNFNEWITKLHHWNVEFIQ